MTAQADVKAHMEALGRSLVADVRSPAAQDLTAPQKAVHPRGPAPCTRGTPPLAAAALPGPALPQVVAAARSGHAFTSRGHACPGPSSGPMPSVIP